MSRACCACWRARLCWPVARHVSTPLSCRGEARAGVSSLRGPFVSVLSDVGERPIGPGDVLRGDAGRAVPGDDIGLEPYGEGGGWTRHVRARCHCPGECPER